MARLSHALLMLVATWQLAVPVRGTPPSCAGDADNCRASGCCATPGYTCFEKDQSWSGCRATCTPGIDPEDPLEYRQPWSCAVVAPSLHSDGVVSRSSRELREEQDQEANARRRFLGRVEELSGSPRSSSSSSVLAGVAVALLLVVTAQP